MIRTKTYPATKSFSNVFDDFFTPIPTTFGNFGTGNSSAPVNITEHDNAYHLDFYVPGRNKEDFKIYAENELLTVSSEKKEQAGDKDAREVRKEFFIQGFKRSFSFNDKVNADGIEAKYENGVLKVLLPKKEEVKNAPKQISIQ